MNREPVRRVVEDETRHHRSFRASETNQTSQVKIIRGPEGIKVVKRTNGLPNPHDSPVPVTKIPRLMETHLPLVCFGSHGETLILG